MPLFGPRPDPDVEARNRRSQEQMARGDLPLSAEGRLTKLRADGGLWTSNLSANEFLLAREDGLSPLGQVMGLSVYHMGWQYTPTYSSTELTTLTHAQSEARRLALSRLQQEAAHLGAHGVVGVRLERGSSPGENLVEWKAIGTAIHMDKPQERTVPWISALSGQDFWTLRRAGYHPVGVAFGTCSYYCVASYSTQWATQGGLLGGGWRGNMELTDYTKAVYTARHKAMSRMEKDGARVGAEGIVGVTIDLHTYPYEVKVNDQERRDLIVHFAALGTAVTENRDRWPIVDYSLPLSG